MKESKRRKREEEDDGKMREESMGLMQLRQLEHRSL